MRQHGQKLATTEADPRLNAKSNESISEYISKIVSSAQFPARELSVGVRWNGLVQLFDLYYLLSLAL